MTAGTRGSFSCAAVALGCALVATGCSASQPDDQEEGSSAHVKIGSGVTLDSLAITWVSPNGFPVTIATPDGPKVAVATVLRVRRDGLADLLTTRLKNGTDALGWANGPVTLASDTISIDLQNRIPFTGGGTSSNRAPLGTTTVQFDRAWQSEHDGSGFPCARITTPEGAHHYLVGSGGLSDKQRRDRCIANDRAAE